MALTMSSALKAHLAQPYQTTCTLWKCDLVDQVTGAIIETRGFTDLDADVIFDDGGGSVTYIAAEGYTRTDIAGAADLSVDNLDVGGLLKSPAITDAELSAGIWDYAKVTIYLVNWADLSMGSAMLRKGRLGEVNLGRDTFKAGLHGLTQFYARTIGENTSPGCRAQLFDARCKVDPTSFTVTGTVTGINPLDPTVVFDTGRTEPGPSGSIAITQVTTANPGVVRLASSTNLFNGLAVTIAGVVGPDEVNATTIVRNLDTTHDHFDLPISTLSFPAYVSGGTVTPLGEDSGYFDNGVITWLTGNNAGLKIEVSSYVPGQFILVLPMPYAIQVGDTYSAVAGCDKSLGTCRTKFANVVNMRAEPYMIGVDQLLKVGTQAP